MTVLYLEPDTAHQSLQRLNRILETWIDAVEDLNRMAHMTNMAWDAPAAEEFVSRLQGLRWAYVRRLRMAEELHRLAWKEYYQWLEMDGQVGAWRFWLKSIGTKLEWADSVDDWKERLFSGFQLGVLGYRLLTKTPYMAGFNGVIVVGGKQQFLSLGALLTNVHAITAKRSLRVVRGRLGEIANPKSLGFWLTVGTEFIEEFVEDPEYPGDVLRSSIDTGTEVAVGVATSVAIAGVGTYMGSFVGGAIGGAIGGPVGAVIGMKAGAIVGPIAAQWVAESVKIGGLPATEWLEEQVSDWVTEPVADAVEDAAEAVGEAAESASFAIRGAVDWAEDGIRSVVKFFGG